MSRPSRGTFAACCAVDVSGTVSRLRMSVTMHPMVLPHMVISSRQPHADLLLSMEAEPLINRPFCPGNAILAGFSSSFAQCPLSALAGRHDDGDLICLARRAVNNPNPSMKAERVVF